MNLIDQQDVNTTSYKKAAVIMFNNAGTTPEMQVFARTYQPPVIEEQPNGND